MSATKDQSQLRKEGEKRDGYVICGRGDLRHTG